MFFVSFFFSKDNSFNYFDLNYYFLAKYCIWNAQFLLIGSVYILTNKLIWILFTQTITRFAGTLAAFLLLICSCEVLRYKCTRLNDILYAGYRLHLKKTYIFFLMQSISRYLKLDFFYFCNFMMIQLSLLLYISELTWLKDQEYICFMGKDLSRFKDIWCFLFDSFIFVRDQDFLFGRCQDHFWGPWLTNHLMQLNTSIKETYGYGIGI